MVTRSEWSLTNSPSITICIISLLSARWHAVRNYWVNEILLWASIWNIVQLHFWWVKIPAFSKRQCKLVEKGGVKATSSVLVGGGAAAALDGHPREVHVSWCNTAGCSTRDQPRASPPLCPAVTQPFWPILLILSREEAQISKGVSFEM